MPVSSMTTYADRAMYVGLAAANTAHALLTPSDEYATFWKNKVHPTAVWPVKSARLQSSFGEAYGVLQ